MAPVGFKRSRALWDEARRPHPTRIKTLKAYAAAIGYELQPIRFSESNKQQVLDGVKNFIQFLFTLVKGIPAAGKRLFSFLQTRTMRQWAMAGGVLAYYLFVRWTHELLDAGPIIVILTALTLIFTIGLSDEKREGLSAYSVFNRGFQRLMGSVDVDSLLAQHVGGGLGGAGGMMNQHDQDHADNDNDNLRHQDNRRQDNQHDEDADEDLDDEEPERNQNDNDVNNRARKSGKKARRRNLEQRRDLRRQREAALQMGLDGTELDGTQTPEEVMAMQRLIEEQIAAENNNE